MRVRPLAALFVAALWPALAFSQVTQGNVPVFRVDNTGQHIEDAGFAPTPSLDVRNAGADPTGVADSSPAFQAMANLSHSARYQGGVFAGTYKLNSTVTSGPNTAWFFGPGVVMPGPGFVDGVVNGYLNIAADSTGFGFVKRLDKAGDAGVGSATQNAVAVQAVGGFTNSLAGYQKDGFVSAVRQLDPSYYGAPAQIDRSLAAIEGQATLGVVDGQIWAQHGLAVVPTGMSGLVLGGEFQINNVSGIDADPVYNTKGQQIAIHAVSGGTNKITTGIKISGGNNSMFDGLVATTNIGTKHFIGLISNPVTDARPFAVDWTGAVFARYLQFTANGAAQGPIMATGSPYSTVIQQDAAGQNVFHTVANLATGVGTASTLVVATGTASNALNLAQNDELHSAIIASQSGDTGGLQVEALAGNLLLGTGIALATNTNSGHLQIPTMAGAPTGTNGALGRAAIVWDSTNLKLWISTGGGTWKYVQGL